ncbi:MAG: hypothetical protein ACLUDD_04815 [Lactobacillus kalixensis]|uniref:hypothetical protein n=1 Tax=Lactobacillus kalixensis TaxID=227944 RepID=UPI003991B5F8
MTEETTITPAWQTQADKLEKAVEQGFGVQVVYKSTAENPCQPVLLSEKQETTSYPYVVEKPEGYIAPKFDWYGTDRGWIEAYSEQQGKDLAAIKQEIATIKQDNASLKAANEDLQKASENHTEEAEKQSKQNQNIVAMMQAFTVQMSKQSQAINAVIAKLDAQSQPTSTTDTTTDKTQDGGNANA